MSHTMKLTTVTRLYASNLIDIFAQMFKMGGLLVLFTTVALLPVFVGSAYVVLAGGWKTLSATPLPAQYSIVLWGSFGALLVWWPLLWAAMETADAINGEGDA